MDVATATILFPAIDPVALRLGPFAVRWYGLAYLAGFAVAYHLLRRMIARGGLRLPAERLSDLLGALVLGVVLGGRFGWWIFYHRSGFDEEPWWEPFAIWRGGMSFHGGLIGVVLALLIWSWRRAPFWNIADALALVAPVGLFLGRLANFVNAELVGRPTLVPWGVLFPGDVTPRHPSQIYEAILEGPLLFLVLSLVRRRGCGTDGRVAGWFVSFYGAFRFAAEFTREPDPQLGFVMFGWLTMGQLLSGALVLAGVAILKVKPCATLSVPPGAAPLDAC